MIVIASEEATATATEGDHSQQLPPQQHGWLRGRLQRVQALQRARVRLSQLSARLRPFRKRLPSARRMHVPKRAERQIRRLGPALLVLCLAVYLLLGASAFLFLEHTNHEQQVRKWFFNLIVNRHKFARQISSAIFNGTRNMLIIVDHDSSERIQRDLVHLLSQYEHQLSLRMPDLNEWTLENSLTYAWGLVTTIGHGHRSPKTKGGQLFALFYCLLGVPFFVITLLVVSHRLFELCRLAFHCIGKKRPRPLSNHHLSLMLSVIAVYVLWLFLFASLLYTQAIPESFWRSLYTAVLTSLTIQSADYNAMEEPQKALALGGATLSLLLSCIGILSLTGVYRYGKGDDGGGGGGAKAPKRRANRSRTGSAASGGAAVRSTASTAQTTPRFQAFVDEAGDTKLASVPSSSSPSPPPNNKTTAKGGGRKR